jgi:hypothetical protein
MPVTNITDLTEISVSLEIFRQYRLAGRNHLLMSIQFILPQLLSIYFFDVDFFRRYSIIVVHIKVTFQINVKKIRKKK